MGSFICKTIHIQENHGASAFIFDLRNSTKITRFISYDERLSYHVDYMRELHKFIYSTLYGTYSTGSDKDLFAINDTGDGYLCAFWGKSHSLNCMKMAIAIRMRLRDTLPKHNEKLKLRNKDYKLDHGFAIHTGGLTVERVRFNDRGGKLIYKDFILGILPNSVARLEKLNKLYTEYDFVASGNYKACFLSQAKDIGKNELINLFDNKSQFVHKSLGRIDINDGKSKGHNIYAIDELFFKSFQENYK